MTEIITKIGVLKISFVLKPLMLYLDFGDLGKDRVSKTICFGWKTKSSHVSAFEHITVFTHVGRPLPYMEFINVALTTRARLADISGDQSEEPSLLMKSEAS